MDTSLELIANTRPVWPALKRGFAGKCPNCGVGRIFRAYLKVNDHCPICATPLHHQRADDAPPYFTMLVTGHLVGAMMLTSEELNTNLPIWLQMLIWPLLALCLCLTLLPVFKGGLIAYQWALRMHGFANEPDYLV